MSEFGRYVIAKTASKVYAESRSFFKELEEAEKISPVCRDGKTVEIVYNINGEEKSVRREEILAHAKRMRTSLLMAKRVLS